MVVRTRFRSIVIPLVLFLLSGAAGSYFVWHAQNGERGLKTKLALKAEIRELNEELEGLMAQRKAWERRISMLQPDQIDKDLLDEEARLLLGRMGKNEIMILLPN